MDYSMQSRLIFDSSTILQDIEIHRADKKFLMLGSAGKARELSILKNKNPQALAVFVGLGLGHAVAEYLENTKKENAKIVIIDKEDFIENSEYKSALEAIFENPRVTIINTISLHDAMKKLLLWQKENASMKFEIYYNSQYSRIDNVYYKTIEKQIEIAEKGALFENIKINPFKKKDIKVLFIAKNGMTDELAKACANRGIESKNIALQEKFDREKYAHSFLEAIISYRPDMILTINHLGIDKDGAILELIKKASLPLASIVVDNPHIMLSPYTNLADDMISIFTYDKDTVPLLKEMGYRHTDFLPLGTSSSIHANNTKGMQEWENEVSFVGSTLYDLVKNTIENSTLTTDILATYKEIAHAFIKSPLHGVEDFLVQEFAHIVPLFEALDTEDRLAFEKIIIWESTSQYRQACVEQIFDFDAVIAGDRQWESIIQESGKKCRFKGKIPYEEIGNFYKSSKINFNATSTQMKNAVNQRVFDVSACGAFLITDWRAQMDELMESGKEIISYKDKEEVPDLISYYLKHEKERNAIAEAGRKRVLAEHTWEKRLEKIIDIMSQRYA